MDISGMISWALIVIGALVTFLPKPLILRSMDESTPDELRAKKEKTIYITKLIGMWLVIIGAAMIFIAGGMYGRH